MARERVDVSFPPAVKLAVLAAGLLLVAMVVLLVAQLAILADSREHIVAQDRKINRIVKGAEPLADDLRPALRGLEPALRELPPTLRDLRPAIRDLAPVLDAIPPLADDVRGALRGLESGRLVEAADLTTQLVEGLRGSEFIPRTLRAADAVPQMLSILYATLDVQQRTLRTQRRTLAIQKRLIATQDEALVHIRSIDRKTGGTAPPTGAPVPAP